MNRIPRFSLAEKVDVTAIVKRGKKGSHSDRPENKSVRRMEDLVNEFLKSGEVVLDRFSGTFVTSKNCKELSQHYPFVNC